MNYEEITIDEDAAIKSAAAIELCTRLAREHYWRFRSIRFTTQGLIIRSEDQGGHPFDAVKIEIAADPKTIQRSCLA